MENPLKEPVGPLCSVARIVPDYHSYRSVRKGPYYGNIRSFNMFCLWVVLAGLWWGGARGWGLPTERAE